MVHWLDAAMKNAPVLEPPQLPPAGLRRREVVFHPGVGKHACPLTPRLHLFSRIEVGRTGHFRQHTHRDLFEFFIPEKGSYHALVNGARLRAAPGQILFIQPGDRHEDDFRRGLACSVLQFHLFDRLDHEWPHGVCREPCPRVMRPKTGTWFSSLTRLLRRGRCETLDPLRVMEPALQAFFWEWVAALPDDRLSTRLRDSLRDDRFEREALAFFSESRGERFDMGALSRRLGLSPRALEYRFRRHFGTSPARALAAHKVKEGALMLRAGAMVNEVADALGFANPFHFSRVFKRIMKVTPSTYREG